MGTTKPYSVGPWNACSIATPTNFPTFPVVPVCLPKVFVPCPISFVLHDAKFVGELSSSLSLLSAGQWKPLGFSWAWNWSAAMCCNVKTPSSAFQDRLHSFLSRATPPSILKTISYESPIYIYICIGICICIYIYIYSVGLFLKTSDFIMNDIV